MRGEMEGPGFGRVVVEMRGVGRGGGGGGEGGVNGVVCVHVGQVRRISALLGLWVSEMGGGVGVFGFGSGALPSNSEGEGVRMVREICVVGVESMIDGVVEVEDLVGEVGEVDVDMVVVVEVEDVVGISVWRDIIAAVRGDIVVATIIAVYAYTCWGANADGWRAFCFS